jgi:hypothetical protein
VSGQKQRTTFAKQQRERARMEKAAEKRQRREDRKLGLVTADDLARERGEAGFDEYGRPVDAFGNVLDPLARQEDPVVEPDDVAHSLE